MNSFESELEEAISARKIPGTILAAANKEGSLDYLKPFGDISLESGSSPVSTSSTMSVASVTKLVTCVAVMQCVERGLVKLDNVISNELPEWKDPQILKKFDEENNMKPILERAQNPILLEHLLSHTSGITGFEDENIMKYYESIRHTRATLISRYFVSEDEEVRSGALEDVREAMGSLLVEPLIFEPGSDWSYGQGVDWAGQLIERLAQLTLEEYCAENIFKPLGMKDTTYRLLDHPHVAANLLKMTSRKKNGALENTDSIYPLDPKMDMGGSNLYTSAPDFLKLLKSLLRNDGRVLRPETVNSMFDYRLPNSTAFMKFKENAKEYLGGLADNTMTVDHCLAGLVNNEDLIGGRKAGSVGWSGATRCYWWIDNKVGICGFYGSQLMGLHDQEISKGMSENFERAIYEDYDGHSIS